MILLFSFNDVVHLIAWLGDGIVEKIGGIQNPWTFFKGILAQNKPVDWNGFRELSVLYISLFFYVLSFLGIFLTYFLMHFIWSVLYVCAPLMILMFISPATNFVTTNLYKGLLNVVSWKIIWSILGIILLKFSAAPQVGEWDNFFTVIIVNFCIAFSMFFVPFAARSLITSGMSSTASGMAAVTSAITGQWIKKTIIKGGKHLMKDEATSDLVPKKLNKGRTNER